MVNPIDQSSLGYSGRLPNLLIIGAMKSGTTSLCYYLNLHPEITMARKKEVNFFSGDRLNPKDINWYSLHFNKNTKIAGEASPSYTNYPLKPGVAERIFKLIPDVKLIYILRDPIDRMISQYVHRYAENTENRTIEEVFENLDDNPYIQRSQYAMQLDEYLSYFPMSNILITTAEELNGDRERVLRQIFSFLEVTADFYHPKFDKKIHRSSFKRRKTELGLAFSKRPIPRMIAQFPSYLRYPIQEVMYYPFSRKVERPRLSPTLREKITNYLKLDVEKLREQTGKDFSMWSF